jgi:hypothetical protein
VKFVVVRVGGDGEGQSWVKPVTVLAGTVGQDDVVGGGFRGWL